MSIKRKGAYAMPITKDVTNLVSFGNPDDEQLEITKCICGAEFNIWAFTISIYKDQPDPCPNCGRMFFFNQKITIQEVVQ